MLKLNVGFTKKVGEPNYGSRGASVNLELELDSGLVGDADRLKDRIRHLFTMARSSVDEELSASNAAASSAPANGNTNGTSNGNGSKPAGDQANGRKRDGTRWATASQIRALNAIAERHQIDLPGLLVERFQIHDLAGLTITEASSLIDELKNQTAGNGHGGRR